MNHDFSFRLAIKVEVQEKMHVEIFSQDSNTLPKMCENVKKWVSSIPKREALWEF
jgi:hypothetical protein